MDQWVAEGIHESDDVRIILSSKTVNLFQQLFGRDLEQVDQVAEEEQSRWTCKE